MDELERRTEHLLSAPWLQGSIADVEQAASALERRHRQRVVPAMVVFVLLVGLAATAALAFRRGTSSALQLSAAQQRAIGCSAALRAPLADSSLVVTMEPSASPDQTAAVRRTIDAIPGIRDVVFVDKAANLANLRDVFSNQPDVLSSVTEDSINTIFTANLDGPEAQSTMAAAASRIAGLPGVDQATSTEKRQVCDITDPVVREGLEASVEANSRWAGGVDLMVFLDPDVTDAQQGRVRQVLDASPSIQHMRFFSQQDSYQEFRCLFADQPDLVDGMTLNDLPSSYRLDLGDPTPSQIAEVTGEVARLQGVKAVVSRPNLDAVLTGGTIPVDLYQTLMHPVGCAVVAGQPIK